MKKNKINELKLSILEKIQLTRPSLYEDSQSLTTHKQSERDRGCWINDTCPTRCVYVRACVCTCACILDWRAIWPAAPPSLHHQGGSWKLVIKFKRTLVLSTGPCLHFGCSKLLYKLTVRLLLKAKYYLIKMSRLKYNCHCRVSSPFKQSALKQDFLPSLHFKDNGVPS